MCTSTSISVIAHFHWDGAQKLQWGWLMPHEGLNSISPWAQGGWGWPVNTTVVPGSNWWDLSSLQLSSSRTVQTVADFKLAAEKFRSSWWLRGRNYHNRFLTALCDMISWMQHAAHQLNWPTLSLASGILQVFDPVLAKMLLPFGNEILAKLAGHLQDSMPGLWRKLCEEPTVLQKRFQAFLFPLFTFHLSCNI